MLEMLEFCLIPSFFCSFPLPIPVPGALRGFSGHTLGCPPGSERWGLSSPSCSGAIPHPAKALLSPSKL